MRNWLAVGVAGVVSTLFVAGLTGGCSSSAAPATVSSFCALEAQTECPPVVGLCTEVNEASCEAAVTAQCQATAQTSQSMGRAFQPNNVGSCISALNSVYSALNPLSQTVIAWQNLNGTCGTSAPCPGSPNDACAQVFQGTLPTEANCTTTYQCTPGLVCGSYGQCGEMTVKTAPNGCADPGDVCAAPAVCSLEIGNKTPVCTPGATVGQVCSDTIACESSAECKQGTCVALGAPGNPCTTSADCDPTNERGAFCDPATHVCSAGYDLGSGGASGCKSYGG